jgi:glyoxylase-like metal-dependent hydrolase (beta-lactamase superfamily II)/rhodanese-related sulfurtransferase
MTDTRHPVTIDAEALRQRLVRRRPTIVVDLRASAAHAEWRVPGSQSVDAGSDLQHGDSLALEDWSPASCDLVVTVCESGISSLRAALQLRARGIDARSLEGGMPAWSLAWNEATVTTDAARSDIVQLRRVGKGCLSYVIGSDGEAIVVDPSLDPSVYEAVASDRGWRIRYVLDTHVHADHVSRARTLAERQHATLYVPQCEHTRYSHTPVRDGDRLCVGASRLVAHHVPGHTQESTAFLLDDAVLFSGDTLLLGSIGRPDLHGLGVDIELQSRTLYRSLQRLRGLPWPVLVLPGHADDPPAFDGIPIAEPLHVVLLRSSWSRVDEDAFVDSVRSHVAPTPANHRLIMRLNEEG